MERIRKLLKSDQAARWIFEGDSITHGALHTFGFRDYTEHFTERIRFEMGRVRDVVIKTAVSGHTTQSLLDDFDWRVTQFRPHAVFLMFGMNDCAVSRNLSKDKFRLNLETICRKIAQLESVPVLQTTCPVVPGMNPERDSTFDAYMEIIRETAAREKLPLIDHTRYWREIEGKQPGTSFYWMSDSIHPGQFGHQVFSELLFKALGIFDAKAPTCRFFRP